jgi:exodeoxyribonuclease-3
MNWKLLSWNVNGIRSAEKKGFLDWLISSGADLVAIQETKAHPGQLSPALLNPPGYQSAWNSAEKKRLQWNRYVHPSPTTQED